MLNALIKSLSRLSVLLAIALRWSVAVFWLKKRTQPDSTHEVLIVRLDQTLGDSVMNSPFLRETRIAYPRSIIRLVVHPRIKALVECCPYVDEIFVYDWGSSLPRSLLARHFLALKFSSRHFRRGSPDIALVPRYNEDHHAALLAFFSGAARRVGYDERVSARKTIWAAGFNRLFTDVISASGIKHEVERNLDVLRYLGAEPKSTELEFWSTTADATFAQKAVSEAIADIPGDVCLIGLGLSSGYSPFKQWSIAKYLELARGFDKEHCDRTNVYLLVGYGEEDQQCAETFCREYDGRVVSMVGKTSLREMAEILRHCELFVGNDSGAMHVAAAAGTRVRGVFGSSCHHRFAPWGNRCDVATLQLSCGPCGTHLIDRCSRCIYEVPRCMTDLTAEAVLSGLSKNAHASLRDDRHRVRSTKAVSGV